MEHIENPLISRERAAEDPSRLSTPQQASAGIHIRSVFSSVKSNRRCSQILKCFSLETSVSIYICLLFILLHPTFYLFKVRKQKSKKRHIFTTIFRILVTKFTFRCCSMANRLLPFFCLVAKYPINNRI